LGILTGLVIATLIIVGAYVGYHAWETSLHEEVEKHSEIIEIETFQTEPKHSLFHIQIDLHSMIG
jgi:hypothetical protein